MKLKCSVCGEIRNKGQLWQVSSEDNHICQDCRHKLDIASIANARAALGLGRESR